MSRLSVKAGGVRAPGVRAGAVMSQVKDLIVVILLGIGLYLVLAFLGKI
jgi:hypothetical protein